ncbi:putative autophagy ubiquitin-activating enzyme ApgG [Aspergillus homomorphus CBS 101889]|uniref:Ubiquitin-like modifier-activating enzyme ATG7 n=1 Tax=Aspergillus homomorphus (strain CBS 101889) TaxID=1450537 RepID=A0A395HJE4_ASPHC|nr:putative autophagy ubiquitin-activating enzyme ApgG [Aspergillus homomorphus CBS 101889]RAL07553.1 putative autophagy ubiquitin-activating enzyme ApgG [Aspergillus homomorphus CBS 101889]
MQYAPFASDIELPFYAALTSLKINHDKLNDSARKILGLYELRPTDSPEASCRMQIHGDALTNEETPAGYYRAEGTIKNVNTIEEYMNTNKSHMLQQAGEMIWAAIRDGSIYSSPSLLSSFVVLSYADLKKYKFHYWFAFPALHSDPPWVPLGESDPNMELDQNASLVGRTDALTQSECLALAHAVQAWSETVDNRQRGFFLARRVCFVRTSASRKEEAEDQKSRDAPNIQKPHWQIGPLSSFEEGFFQDADFDDCFVVFADPSNYDDAPGWPLRNLLLLAKQRWRLDKIRVLRYRDVSAGRHQCRSTVLTLKLKKAQASSAANLTPLENMPRVTGWERNPSGRLTGRLVDLTGYMDPQKLADQSVDLNLKLMKWRISPNLNLEKIKATKCLLLGAGTLGSYVARNLMGWGVSRITFIDNGSVSFSNPVRQPLFKFTDCLEGGAKKAHRASQALTEIYPGVESAGHVLSVPMVGHPVIDVEKTRADFETLRDLIDCHDVIFLLMDTRESRWLPTVMGKAAGKIVMNAALGFDSFVVMRHGVKSDVQLSEQLGCYFCNDVVAPMNSTKDQTLDQQCTVTRPGVAAIASALLVELLVSIIQHPLGAAAPAPVSRDHDRGDHPLGLLPHQIRGFLPTFENVSVVGRSYKFCSACSDNIVGAFEKDGWDFVLRVLNEPGYLEVLSGLKEVQATAEASLADIEWDEDSELDEREGLSGQA